MAKKVVTTILWFVFSLIAPQVANEEMETKKGCKNNDRFTSNGM